MFERARILVVGSGETAQRVAAGLQEGGRRTRWVEDLGGAGSGMRSLHTLILAEPTADRDGLIDGLSGICRRRPARYPPLRLILVRCKEDATLTPILPSGCNLTIETFDPEVRAARSLLTRWPPHAGMDPPYGQTPHILIAGRAPPASALLLQTLRLLHYGDTQPVITLACEDQQSRGDDMTAAYPQATRFCRLRFTAIESIDLDEVPPVTSAFVCLTLPEEGLATARRLAARIEQAQHASPPIYLEVGDAKPRGDPADWDGQIFPFSWRDDVLRPQVLLEGRGDDLARVIHEHYQDSIAAQGRDPEAEPAGRLWESLDASYKDASRHQADHLHAKLAALDCRAVREDLVETFTFAPLEVEKLATIEHRRWAADRYLDGWTYGPMRDNARKHHPQLIPYADLSEPMKDLDRFAVRLVPTLLARSGRGLVRILLVAVVEPGGDCPLDPPLWSLADAALDRLMGRYPDRSLVLASTLEGKASRLVARRALDRLDAGLFLLCPRPLSETLTAQPSDGERRDLLELVARAERRIALPGAGEPDAWVARRAEIGLLLGAQSGTRETGTGVPPKQVLLDPRAGRLDWSFEY